MCGICGFVDLKGAPVEEGLGRRMTDLLHHRGPDGEGFFVGTPLPGERRPSVLLGHRRLKIIDLSEAARQPMSNEDGAIQVILNGEIYNYRELRQTLRARGHAFRSSSDTEVIVHAYEEFGQDFIRHLDGMFAFALWDRRRDRLIIARDRSGKKPLYYAFDGRRFSFASEIKALLVLPWVAREIDTDRAPEYLTFGYVPQPHTFYRGVLQLPPASYLVVTDSGPQPPVAYWRLNIEPTGPRGVETAAARVKQLMVDAVARRMISDVPLGALLSGGLDSTIVVGVMSQLTSTPVRTFAVGFPDDLSYDERPYAALAARAFQTAHTDSVVRADAAGLLETLIWHFDQPFGDSSAIPTYLVAKEARQHVTVALNGDGGDEVFAGYDRFLAALLAERIPGFIGSVANRVARGLPGGGSYFSVSRRFKRFFEGHDLPVEDRFLGWISLFDQPTLSLVLRPEQLSPELHDRLRAPFVTNLRYSHDRPLLDRLLLLNFTTYLQDDLHVKMDRMSMANSLETRSPMLDTGLLEFLASLPPSLKIHGLQTKYVLKQAFQDLIPRKILHRKKHGFGVPLNHWFRHQLRPYVERTLLAKDARVNGLLNGRGIRQILEEHVSGMRDHGYRLWALLTIEVWLRLFETGRLWTPNWPRLRMEEDEVRQPEAAPVSVASDQTQLPSW